MLANYSLSAAHLTAAPSSQSESNSGWLDGAKF